MRIHVLPLLIDGATDLETGDVFISSRLLNSPIRFWDCLKHELCHLIVGSNTHCSEWSNLYKSLNPIHSLFTQETGSCFPLALNIGNISGIQNILTDYHLLQAYRKFSRKILGTEGHWEVIGEVEGNVEGDSLDAKDQLIRLYPTPKGSFPVVVLYVPTVNHFRSPQARQVCYDMLLAEAKIVLGSSRRKIQGMPSPDGGSINYDGSELIQEGEKMKEEIIERAINLGEPLLPHTW